MLTSVVGSDFGFFSWMLAEKLYPTGDVGIAIAIISAIMLVIVVSNPGMNFSIILFFPENDKSRIFSTAVIIKTFFWHKEEWQKEAKTGDVIAISEMSKIENIRINKFETLHKEGDSAVLRKK